MKKKLNVEGITSELEGASVFFTRPVRGVDKSSSTTEPTTALSPTLTATPSPAPPTAPHRHNPTDNTASPQANRHASMLASYPDSRIETIRKAVRHIGREVTFVRLTPEEKSQLADIVYTYKRQGVKTSENEISRIAISYLLEDYKTNGQESILAKVIASLLA